MCWSFVSCLGRFSRRRWAPAFLSIRLSCLWIEGKLSGQMDATIQSLFSGEGETAR